MFFLLVVVIALVIIFFLVLGNSNKEPVPKDRADDAATNGWEYGDVWKQGSPDVPAPHDDIRYVEILRGDTGMGYDDTYMLELIGYLASRGISSTYDAVPLAMEAGGAIKTYVLKVESGSEEEAMRYLREKESR
jgi:hypothetical protein